MGILNRLKLSELAISQLRHIWKNSTFFEMGINGFFSVPMPKKLDFIIKKVCFGHYGVDLPVCCPQNFQNVGMGCAFLALYAQNH
ncbi:MAG: hypothetical protein IJ405_03815 [Lachnospiraceae bacterium]|nr:hypothetical protein [Lachnospiraceae bacterium]